MAFDIDVKNVFPQAGARRPDRAYRRPVDSASEARRTARRAARDREGDPARGDADTGGEDVAGNPDELRLVAMCLALSVEVVVTCRN